MLYVGTSGWQYDDWKGAFYPPELAKSGWLEFYTRRFATVEVNNTFYRLPDRAAFTRWAHATPPGFSLAVKLSRYISHIKRLREPREPIQRFTDRAAALGDRRGPTLLQLPPTFEADLDRLRDFLTRWPSDWLLALEFRHDSWFSEAVFDLLAEYRVALCLADRDERPITPVRRTADWTYLRLHAGLGPTPPGYRKAALSRWLERLIELSPSSAYIYFNNDAAACAVADASTMVDLAAQADLDPVQV